MTKLEEVYAYLEGIVSDILFEYQGKDCGVDPLSRTEYDVWYGEKAETMTSVEDVFQKPFFDGKSLTDIFPEIAESIGW